MKIYENIVGKTNADFVYKNLKRNILELNLLPGAEIKEQELSAIFNVSRTPIREALLLLKHDGLIKTLPQSGTFVKKIDKDKFEIGQILRICVEVKMIQLACSNFPQEYLDKLKENIEKQKFIYHTTKNAEEYHRLDVDFHRIIFTGVGFTELYKITSKEFYDYLRVRKLNSSNKIKDDYILKSHEQIYEIIKNRRPELAQEALDQHFIRLKKKLPLLIEEYPEYFKQ
ncbi:GntR family transcriptional regulator [Fusobacterium sp. SYSU M8A802]